MADGDTNNYRYSKIGHNRSTFSVRYIALSIAQAAPSVSDKQDVVTTFVFIDVIPA
jgi:hypothetical protein